MHLDWIKNTQNNSWFDLLRLNLDSPYFSSNVFGIYVIWYTDPNGGKVIKIHAGNIGENLKADKLNSEIMKYSQLGQLKVTWATNISTNLIPGIIAFLNSKYNPILSDPVPINITKTEVNLIGS